MANKRISKEKQVYILAALSEGTPINAVCRMFKVGKNGVLRVIRETGAALADYMDETFRGLECDRLAIDEQWQYVHTHGQRMDKEVEGRGDYWLWCAIDPDTKLVVSYSVGRRDWNTGEAFIADVASRVCGPVQIATDNARVYEGRIRAYFDGDRHEGFSYGTETKDFIEKPNLKAFPETRKHGVPKIAKARREAVIGRPDMRTLTTAHIERLFLTVRQELTRYTRLTLGYSKKIGMHRLATAMHLGIYNLCRKHSGIEGQTPAQAAGVAVDRWSLEDVVALTERFMRNRIDAKFEAAFAAKGTPERTGPKTHAPIAPKLPWYLDFDGPGEPKS